MLLPGWGQLYKGSRAKGLCIIAGEVVLAGGIVTAENLRASYMKKIRETHTAAHIKTSADRADTLENVRNLCIAGAAALYLYNLIDALAAPGDMRLVAKERPFALYPVAGDMYMGFGLAINF
jgi:hypothetical protein